MVLVQLLRKANSGLWPHCGRTVACEFSCPVRGSLRLSEERSLRELLKCSHARLLPTLRKPSMPADPSQGYAQSYRNHLILPAIDKLNRLLSLPPTEFLALFDTVTQ